jgi:hypothetical protein
MKREMKAKVAITIQSIMVFMSEWKKQMHSLLNQFFVVKKSNDEAIRLYFNGTAISVSSPVSWLTVIVYSV